LNTRLSSAHPTKSYPNPFTHWQREQLGNHFPSLLFQHGILFLCRFL
jgi:hypothetical protein